MKNNAMSKRLDKENDSRRTFLAKADVKRAAKKPDITIKEVMALCAKHNLDRVLTHSVINLYWSTRK